MRVNWTEFKSFVDARKLSVQWIDLDEHYFLKALDGDFTLEHTIEKTSPASSDQTDFENNYQTDGNKRVGVAKDFFTEVSQGLVPGDSSINKFGSTESLGATFSTVWNSGAIYSYPTTAATVSTSSTDTDDTSAGIGARTIKIEGLDASYNEVSETITMNGTTGVTSTNSYLRVFRAFVTSAGSSGENKGTIDIKQGGNTLAQIIAGLNQTEMALYTVPAGKTAFLRSHYWSIPKDKEAEVRLLVRPLGEVFQVKHQLFLPEHYINHEFGYPLVISAKSDIELRAKSTSGTTHSIASGFDLLLVDN